MAWDPKQARYLDYCIRSIRNLDYPKDRLEVLIVGRDSYLPKYTGVKTINPGLGDQFFASEGYNVGVSQTSGDLVLTANDDVAFTRRSLSLLVESLGPNPAIITGISNCENGLSYHKQIHVRSKGQIINFPSTNYRYEETLAYHDDMLNADSIYPPGLLIEPYLCMFATLIPRTLWDKLDGFDTGLKGGPDDIDFCYRAQAEKHLCLVAEHALIWHFGSVSIETSYPADRWVLNMDYFRNKWGRFPPYVDQARYDRMKEAAEKLPGASHRAGI
jgi:GT2 family glycosyltransferase